MVTDPLRLLVPVCCPAVSVTLAEPLPEFGLMVTHVADAFEVVHVVGLQFDGVAVMVTVWLPPPAANCCTVVGAMENVHVGVGVGVGGVGVVVVQPSSIWPLRLSSMPLPQISWV